MKRWPLRVRLRLFAALLFTAILLVIAGGAGFYVQQRQVEALDRHLRLIAAHFFAEYRENGARHEWITARAVESVIAEAGRHDWFIEITDATGAPLYRGKNLQTRSLATAPLGLSTFDLSEDGVRVGGFRGEGLTLHVGADLDDLNEVSASLLLCIAACLPAVLGIVFFGANGLATRALAPLRELSAAAERVNLHHHGERLPVPQTCEELSRLATVLNATFDRLAAAFTQATRFSADASHEFKTPLALARAELKRMLTAPTLSAPHRESTTAVLGQLRRINEITNTLLVLSRADAGLLQIRATTSDLATLVRACAEDAEVTAAAQHLTLSIDAPPHVPARFDLERTTLVLQNLFSNAVKYNAQGGRIEIRLKPSASVVAVEIANTGPGIAPEHQAQLFARFFRAAAPAEIPGHGLGLSLSRELARAQGGDVILGESLRAWTRFIFTIPAG